MEYANSIFHIDSRSKEIMKLKKQTVKNNYKRFTIKLLVYYLKYSGIHAFTISFSALSAITFASLPYFSISSFKSLRS